MTKVRLLFTADSAGLGEKIALGLEEQGVSMAFGLHDEGDLDPQPVVATLVVWSRQSVGAPAILDAARAAFEARRLVPINISTPAPDFLSGVQPISLMGWNGSAADPRWKFVLDEIALAEKRQAEAPSASAATSEKTAVASAEATRAAAPPAREPSSPQSSSPLLSGPERSVQEPRRPLSRAGADHSIGADEPDLRAKRSSARAASMHQTSRRQAPDLPQAARPLGLWAAGAAALAAAGVLGAVVSNAWRSKEPEEAPLAAAQTPPPVVAFVEPAPSPAGEAAPGGRLREAAQPAPAYARADESAVVGDDAVSGNGVSDADAGPAEIGPSVPETPTDKSDRGLAAAPEGEGDQAYPDDDDPIAKLAWAVTSTTGAAAATASPPANQYAIGRSFQDCPACPVMTVAPPGDFLMGAPPGEASRSAAEGPQRRVSVARPFAIGAYEVTFAEWDACVDAGACGGRRPSDIGWGRGRRPVVNVSYEDALEYVRWLSDAAGKPYRLPSEAEWEYAARADGPGPFGFSGRLTTDRANFHGAYPYGGPKGVYRRRTTPVGSFEANAFGLYDVHGNVMEWTADCWVPSHEAASADASPVSEGAPGASCAERVVKGGAWSTGGWRLRAAYREGAATGERTHSIGFRVARDVP